jgi:NAD(P)-dependent dehydrogenase (short-subunit alcohol dehydrogenase family)
VQSLTNQLSPGGRRPLLRPPQVAPSYVFLASEDASFFTGTTLHPNGGTPVNS